MKSTGDVTVVASSARNPGARPPPEDVHLRILDAAPDALICVDALGKITFGNARAEHLFGHEPGDLVGRPVESLLAEKSRADHMDDRQRCLRGSDRPPDVASRQAYGRRSDGTVFAAEIRLAVVEIAGRLLTIEAFRDVAERLAIEQVLHENEERFRQLAASLAFGYLLREVDPVEYLYASPGFLTILGLDPDDPVPSPEALRNMVHPDDRARLQADLAPPSAVEHVIATEMRIIRADGEIRWIRSTSSPVRAVDGTVNRVATTIEDITARTIAEEVVLSARREAEDANAAKSEFLARMSHELRTPLNAVLGFAQLLELDVLSKAQRGAVGHILHGGRHLLAMVDDILDISRIETDQLELSIESVLVADLLSETVGLMQPAAAAAQIDIRYSTLRADADRYVLADRRRLRQVVLNLLSNGIKYNRRGGRLDVACELIDAAHVGMHVSDTGIGIRPEDMNRLFVPFDRFGAQVAEVEGTGIGLALSQRLAETMGGRLEVDSEFGIGSTFSIVMPIAESPDTELSAATAETVQDMVRAVDASTLLYIEDNLANVRLIERILDRRPGWTMVHAGQGSLGLEFAKSIRPELILLDLHLPDTNGLDVLRTLRSDPETAEIPVVVVSADASLHQIGRLHAAGAEHYLTKPLDVAEVLRLLDVHAGHQPDPVGPPPDAVANRTVLYVEDDAANVRLVERIIELRPAVDLVVVGTGRDGIRVAQESAPELILLDRGLPDMAAGEVLRELKAAPLTATVPVVMLSGDAGRAQVAEMLDLGAVDYLAKPFDLDALLAVIDRFCGTAEESGPGS